MLRATVNCCFIFAIIVNQMTVILAQDRLFHWVSNNAGFFSQFLQLKIMKKIADRYNRTIVAPFIMTQHFNGTIVSLCDILVLPKTVQCNKPDDTVSLNISSCSKTLNHSLLSSEILNYCYDGPVPLLGEF
jgi:hypothetical protein